MERKKCMATSSCVVLLTLSLSVTHFWFSQQFFRADAKVDDTESTHLGIRQAAMKSHEKF